MTAPRARVQAAALIRAWLLMDFFSDTRRAGDGAGGSSLTTTIMWQALLSFGFAMLLYPDVATVPFVAANLSLSTLLVCVGALGDEQRPLRLAADDALIAGAPVAPLTVVLARSGHASFHLALVTVGMAISPAILLGHLTGSALHAAAYVVAACACTGLANAGLATSRAVIARAFGDARATLAMGTVKAAMLGCGFVLFALALRKLDGTADDLPIGRLGAELLPTYHAARLLAEFPTEAWRLWIWLLVAGALLAVQLLTRLGGARARGRVRRRSPLLGMLRAISGRGPRLGVAEFVALSMWRSAGFRARVLPLLGLPAGMVFLTLGGGEGDDYVLLCLLLMLPAIYLPFLIAFLPRADQANTGWVFDHAPKLSRDLVSDATWRALTTHVLTPTYALALLLVVGFGPERLDRAAAALFAFAAAVLAAERMARLDRVPFTDDREEDRGLDLGALMAGALALGLLGTAFGAAAPPHLRWPIALAALGLAAARLRRLPAPDLRLLLAVTDGGNDARQEAGGAAAGGADERPAAVEPTIGRELRAVAVLYCVLCVLPLVAGAMFAA